MGTAAPRSTWQNLALTILVALLVTVVGGWITIGRQLVTNDEVQAIVDQRVEARLNGIERDVTRNLLEIQQQNQTLRSLANDVATLLERTRPRTP